MSAWREPLWLWTGGEWAWCGTGPAPDVGPLPPPCICDHPFSAHPGDPEYAHCVCEGCPCWRYAADALHGESLEVMLERIKQEREA